MKSINIPIILTWLRIAMIPVVIGLYYLPIEGLSIALRDWLGAAAFVVAAITDWLDGYLARRWGQTSAFGAFLDPVADKLMVCAALLVLLDLGRVESYIALIIIGRELTISALREWMASVGARGSVAVNQLGKFKTAAQMAAIPCLMVYQTVFGIDLVLVGEVLIFLAAFLTLWSMFYYLSKAWPALKHADKK
ncbi:MULTISPECIES: CDP-diacylglycerol--glycerol-3-phosphate 3-phosphatidyltransferase [Oligella]|uniref:CDP-diacylglycerol--glycerol-3-phosphate 3-phosphatidyltransferase n=1 Tax=Oligella TaxID=90243 RepID=UPI0008A3B658|nr:MULTISPECIES: CDP-diacylglycerol--glycerol-3-phosphate 3-phosphatidyltransferase [Oligella]AVL71303.1 CDP-diacylglycerol--glycerol-3-phosphate 3-phosphatidyltransferase [Oligella urethralis]OFV50633.1 CDP-diacylglycerol--glycerol-3-phosphate 3-phosphatidyltransferase [Oligella sp. HMSC09E12]